MSHASPYLMACANCNASRASESEAVDSASQSPRGVGSTGCWAGAVPVPNIPPMACLRLRPIGVVGVLGQNAPPTDGLRGMIEGRLGRRTGVSRGRRLHFVGRKCPLLGIGGRSDRKRLVRLLSSGRGAGRIILGDPSPSKVCPQHRVSGLRGSPFRHHAHFARAWRSVGARGLLTSLRSGTGQTSESGLAVARPWGPAWSKDCAGGPSEEVAVAVRSAGASL